MDLVSALDQEERRNACGISRGSALPCDLANCDVSLLTVSGEGVTFCTYYVY